MDSPRHLTPQRPLRSTPKKLSELLTAFGASRSPSSLSRMQRAPQADIGHANAARSESSPGEIVAGGLDQPMSNGDDTGDTSSDDVIHAVPRGTLSGSPSTRQLPSRSARQNASYAPPARSTKARTSQRTQNVLLSDTTGPSAKPKATEKPATARNQIRQDIANNTKPKRNAFILANKDLFLRLLPPSNYVAKLHEHANIGTNAAVIPRTTLLSQPEGVTATMKPYQLEGLTFLVHMYRNGMSAVLGDEMGLGKTLQTLSLFQYLKVSEPSSSEETRPFLVICPLSVLSSWAAEAAKWTPDLKVIRFHGPKVERERLKQQTLGFIDRYGSNTGKSKGKRKSTRASEVIDLTEDERPVDLVITTYETFVGEQNWFKRAFAWRYVVLDEGHKIKSEKSDVSSSLQTLRAEHRLLLTGTPLQNNLQELWALLHWLFPEVFPVETAMNFKQAFDLTKGRASTAFMDDARRLLEIIMLRRMKSSPGVDLGLPPKEEVLLFIPLTPMQRWWYTRLLTKADNMLLEDLFQGGKAKIKQELEQESKDEEELLNLQKAAQASEDNDVWAESKQIMANAMQTVDKQEKNEYQKLMHLMTQLRKACSHPYLLPGSCPDPYTIGNHIRIASGKFIVLEKLVQELVVKQRKKVLIFSGWTRTLDMVGDLLALIGITNGSGPLKYARLDGSTQRAKRNLAIRMFNGQDSDTKIMLLSTRAGGLGINLTSATDVVFMDEDWNPQVTLQAEARSHRIGQTKKVTVYKLCTQGTVEEQMMGRIRKKLYLSAKITESMRNLHQANEPGKKRKRTDNAAPDDDAPQLDASQLKSLLRRGAQTLVAPEINIDEMLDWDWQTTLDKCKSSPEEQVDKSIKAEETIDEEAWLNNAEKVETAVFNGKRFHRELDKAAKEETDLTRADRRLNKNTTVMVGGFAISKESMGCADWEAVPTLAGKDPRLAEPVKVKKDPIRSQEFCQVCWDGGDLFCCDGCPRSYHSGCLEGDSKIRAKGIAKYYCPQHQCFDCTKKTAEAGGLMYRCRWCEKGFCEDCLNWDTAHLVDESLPELEMLNYFTENGYFVDCHVCVERWEQDPGDHRLMLTEKARIEQAYRKFQVAQQHATLGADNGPDTLATVSEAVTPVETYMPTPKKQKTSFFAESGALQHSAPNS
ncbi:hypothetical protein Q7P37_008503 [Cladosporium fusiforme]